MFFRSLKTVASSALIFRVVFNMQPNQPNQPARPQDQPTPPALADQPDQSDQPNRRRRQLAPLQMPARNVQANPTVPYLVPNPNFVGRVNNIEFLCTTLQNRMATLNAHRAQVNTAYTIAASSMVNLATANATLNASVNLVNNDVNFLINAWRNHQNLTLAEARQAFAQAQNDPLGRMFAATGQGTSQMPPPPPPPPTTSQNHTG